MEICPMCEIKYIFDSCFQSLGASTFLKNERAFDQINNVLLIL